jgi:nicotinamidase-related amidase
MFPALDMLKEGYEIYVAADACGDLSVECHNRAMDRLVQAGSVPITSCQYAFELQQDWARAETYDGMMEILKAQPDPLLEVGAWRARVGGRHQGRLISLRSPGGVR